MSILPINDGLVTIILPENSVQNTDGTNNAVSNTLSVNYTNPNGGNPTVELSTSSPDVTGEFEIVISFDQIVTGLSESDFQVTNGLALDDLSNVGLNYYMSIDHKRF